MMNENSNIQNYLRHSKNKVSSSKYVFRITNVLICLSRGINSLTDIANACKVDKSTMYRILSALCEAQIAMQDPTDQQYRLGPLVSEIAANPSLTHQSLIVCAGNEMASLASYTGETVGLNGLIGLQEISLYEIPSIHAFRVIQTRKVEHNLHTGATARVLLSQLNKKDLNLVIKNLDFKPVTENTITYKDQWLAHMKMTKERGYGVSYGERLVGAMTISAPIKNYFFPVALDVVGPEARIKPRVNEFTAKLLASTERIQENIKQIRNTKSPS
jgi:DNA-binding IclR family transcriptional regulator